MEPLFWLAVRIGNLLPDKEPAGFIVADIDLRLGQDPGVGGFAQELDEEVHVDGAVEHARPESGQGLGDGVGVRGVDGRSCPPKPCM